MSALFEIPFSLLVGEKGNALIAPWIGDLLYDGVFETTDQITFQVLSGSRR